MIRKVVNLKCFRPDTSNQLSDMFIYWVHSEPKTSVRRKHHGREENTFLLHDFRNRDVRNEISRLPMKFNINGTPFSMLSDPNYSDFSQNTTLYKKSLGEKRASNLSSGRIEIFHIAGPNDSGFVVEVVTENPAIVRKTIARVLNKSVFYLDTSVADKFKMKGVLTTDSISQQNRLYIRARAHATAAGADEVKYLEGSDRLQFITSVDSIMRARSALRKIGYKVQSSSYKFLPLQKVRLTEECLRECKKVMQELEALPGVSIVVHNISE